MFDPAQVVATFEEFGISHIVWLPDSLLGTWEAALESSRRLKLVRVSREGESWAIAAGLLQPRFSSRTGR